MVVDGCLFSLVVGLVVIVMDVITVVYCECERIIRE